LRLRETDQAMCLEGVGTARDLVEMELDTGAAAGFLNARMHRLHRLGTAKLGIQIFTTVAALGR